MKSSQAGSKHLLLAGFLLLGSHTAWGFDLPAENSGDGFMLSSTDNEVGKPVRAIGDINGDQIDDFAVANPFYDAPGAGDQDDRGRVYVVFGQTQALPTSNDLINWINQGHGFIITGSKGDHLGSALAGNCDIDGDGHADLLLSAPYSGIISNTRPVTRPNDPGVVSRSGKVYVINGHANGDAFAASITVNDAIADNNYFNAVILGEEIDDYLGVSLDCSKDLNQDGNDDILIGSGISSAVSSLNSRRGRAYIVFGGSQFTTAAAPAAGRLQVDLRAITASPPSNQGIYIDASQFLLGGRVTPDSFSISLAALGDVNGDNINDFAIGAADASPDYFDGTNTVPNYKSGQVYVLFGGSALASMAIDDLLQDKGNVKGAFLNGEVTQHRLGLDLRWAGDINHDGINDIVLGTPYVEVDGKAEQGRAYVIFGSNTLSGQIDLSTLSTPGTGGSALNGFIIDGVGGSSATHVMGLADVNGDGIDDLAISSHTITSSNRGGGGGGGFVIFGRDQTLLPFPSQFSLAALGETNNGFGFVIYGDQAQEESGEEMAPLGDINHDGLADFAIVSIKHPSQQPGIFGKLYGIYGAANLESVEVREAHHEGATINKTPPPSNILPQHSVGHAWGLLILLSFGFIYRFLSQRGRRQ